MLWWGQEQLPIFQTPHLYARAWWHRRRHRESCWGRHHRAMSSSDRCTTNTLQEFRLSMHNKEHPVGFLLCHLGQLLQLLLHGLE